VRDELTLPDAKFKGAGIAVLYVDIEQPNVTLSIRRINQSSLADSRDDLEELAFIGAKRDTILVDLSGRDGFVSLNLARGLYQIVQIDVPHFDLPYKLSTDNEDTWRFRVREDHISYIGTVHVSKLRSKNTINAVWLNQFATHYAELTELVALSDIQWPIAHGAGYRDSFFSKLEEVTND
jgi:hypothetical protein